MAVFPKLGSFSSDEMWVEKGRLLSRFSLQFSVGMYLDSIRLQNFRTFRDVEIDLVHPDQDFRALNLPKPRLPNLNLLLGNNAMGKTAFLQGVALAAMGPAVGDAGIFPYRLVRREPERRAASPRKRSARALAREVQSDARISARFRPHPQDHAPRGVAMIESEVGIQAKGDLEKLRWLHSDESLWHPIFQSSSDAFFLVGYGATRQVETRERVDLATRRASMFIRAQRIQSLFQDAYSLVPLTAWLPEVRQSNPKRFEEIKTLINRLMGADHFQFDGEMEAGEYVFSRRGLRVPFPALSDGYRAYLGWIGDLLFHVARTCPPKNKLTQNRGIVMIDEIDLHLHPKWQMKVLLVLAKRLPRLQFIVTSHSPLVVGSLEWMNIITMHPAAGESSRPRRIHVPIHGLDADQVLLTDFFGLASTRNGQKQRRLKELTLKARSGDQTAAKELMIQMARGSEA